MRLEGITFTGADDTVDPERLCAVSAHYPYVEWGILVSASKAESGFPAPRFPSHAWIKRLLALNHPSKTSRPMRLSLHVCGRWVRQLLLGTNDVPEWMVADADIVQRLQLNFHGERQPVDYTKFIPALFSVGGQEFIFQVDGTDGLEHMRQYQFNTVGARVSALIDTSHGAGVLPDEWPLPVVDDITGTYIKTGYAGGLGPDNVFRQWRRITRDYIDCPTWLDMETRVRDTDDRFSVDKCLMVLRGMDEYVVPPAAGIAGIR